MPHGPYRDLVAPGPDVRGDLAHIGLFNRIYAALRNTYTVAEVDALVATSAYGQAYDVRTHGASPDASPATNRAAIQATIDEMLDANNGGYVSLGGAGDYHIDAPLQMVAPNGVDLVGFGLTGNGPGQRLVQVADNAPHVELVGSNIHSLFFGGFAPTWDGAPDAAKTQRNVIRATAASTSNIYNSTFRDLLISRGHYAFHASGSMNVWGVDHANIRATEMTGGFATYTGAAGQPNDGFYHIYVGAQQAVGPIFNFNAVNAQMDRIEINQANQGPLILNDNAGGNYVVGLFGVEGGTWAGNANNPDSRLIRLEDSTLEALHIFLTGTVSDSGGANLFRTAGRGHIHVGFLIQEMAATGSGKVFTASVGGSNVRNPDLSRGEIVFGRIRSMTGFVPWSPTGNLIALCDVGGSDSADAVRVEEWAAGQGRQMAWIADANVDHSLLPDTAECHGALTLATTKTYTLPNGLLLPSGYTKTFYKPVTTGDWMFAKPGGAEQARLTAATRGRITLMWNRGVLNGPGYDTWTVVDRTTW